MNISNIINVKSLQQEPEEDYLEDVIHQTVNNG
jgi:hypothetical protein